MFLTRLLSKVLDIYKNVWAFLWNMYIVPFIRVVVKYCRIFTFCKCKTTYVELYLNNVTLYGSIFVLKCKYWIICGYYTYLIQYMFHRNIYKKKLYFEWDALSFKEERRKKRNFTYFANTLIYYLLLSFPISFTKLSLYKTFSNNTEQPLKSIQNKNEIVFVQFLN